MEGDPSEPSVTRLTGPLARKYREQLPPGALRAQRWRVTKATCSGRVGASPGDPASWALPSSFPTQSSDFNTLSHSQNEFTMRVSKRKIKSKKINRDQLADGFS